MSSDTHSHWEKQTMQKVLLEHIQEQRRARRWGIFFKLLTVAFLALLFFGAFSRENPQPIISKEPHTALIDIYGEISAEGDANAESIRETLRTAFQNKQVKGVVLRINSPGGSPVQARQIAHEIRLQRKAHPEIKIYATIEELGTSAAYLIASATDAIYADQTSLIGSIGVIIPSFGFVKAMDKVGVDRRIYAAGNHKAILDPFSPQKPEETAFMEGQLKIVHQIFIAEVKLGRGARLKETPELFSGLFWTGDDAYKLGLIDGFGDAQFVATKLVKAEKIIDYTPRPNFLDKFAQRIGMGVGQSVFGQHWALK